MQSGSLAKTGSRGGEKALVNFDDVVEGDERDERVEDEGECRNRGGEKGW
jgi:hypothetical protein